MTAAPPEPGTRHRLYGRRRGHPLRPARQRLVDELLPDLRVPVGEGEGPLDPARLFDRGVRDVWLEVGFGAGEHLAAQAAAHPEIGFIGCEPYINGVAALLALVEREGLHNVRILDDDARPLIARLAPQSLSRAFALFADPWPKKRHAGRRFLSRANLDALAGPMRDGAELRFATDDPGYIVWALDQALGHAAFEWTARRPGDWRTRPADGFETRYEAKARSAGRAPVFLTFRRRPRA